MRAPMHMLSILRFRYLLSVCMQKYTTSVMSYIPGYRPPHHICPTRVGPIRIHTHAHNTYARTRAHNDYRYIYASRSILFAILYRQIHTGEVQYVSSPVCNTSVSRSKSFAYDLLHYACTVSSP